MDGEHQPQERGHNPEMRIDALRASLEPTVPAQTALQTGERLPAGLRLRLGLRRMRTSLVRGMILLLFLVLAGLFFIQQDLSANANRPLPAAEVRIQLADDLPPPLPTPPLPAGFVDQ
jgi:hypothetical protein